MALAASIYAYERAKSMGDEEMAKTAMQYTNMTLYDFSNNFSLMNVSGELSKVRTSSNYNT
jgi:hypothetical protein